MKKSLIAAVSALGLLLVGGCATPPPSQPRTQTLPTSPPASQLAERNKVTATAIVQAVDPDHREILLSGKGDKRYTVRVDDNVQNLAQIKPKDRIELTYYEALAIDLEKETTGLPPRRTAVTSQRRLPGENPADTMRGEIEIVATVSTVNQKARRVTLYSANDAVTVKVPESIDMSTLKAGDPVKARYLQELATSVEPLRRGRRR